MRCLQGEVPLTMWSLHYKKLDGSSNLNNFVNCIGLVVLNEKS